MVNTQNIYLFFFGVFLFLNEAHHLHLRFFNLMRFTFWWGFKFKCCSWFGDFETTWNENDARDAGPRVYADEEEREATIRYLKNRYVVMEEPFTEVVSKLTKTKKHKSFQVHNTRSKSRLPNWFMDFLLSYISFHVLFIFPFVCFVFNFLLFLWVWRLSPQFVSSLPFEKVLVWSPVPLLLLYSLPF